MRPSTHRPRRPRSGFTLVELLVVIVVLALLAALLLPAINGAVRRAREASVSAEINQLAQALADFKSRYGDYPPSRILLSESCNYVNYISSSTALPTTSGFADINYAQLAQRSLVALRKFFPRVNFSTTAQLFPSGSTTWYDFNGNGVQDRDYILDGRECLVFFLGGIPQYDASGNFQSGMTGFGRNPTNPFTHSIVGSASPTMYSNNRQKPFYEFKGDRLALIPKKVPGTSQPQLSGIPGYVDTNSSLNEPAFYAYFSSYGGAYDPNDVNAIDFQNATTNYETDDNGNLLSLKFKVNFPVYSGGTQSFFTSSPPPNPYTVTPTGGTTVSYQSPQSFQILSPGADMFYGVGGQYAPNSPMPLPFDTANTTPSGDAGIKVREQDNLASFHNGRLQ